MESELLYEVSSGGQKGRNLLRDILIKIIINCQLQWSNNIFFHALL